MKAPCTLSIAIILSIAHPPLHFLERHDPIADLVHVREEMPPPKSIRRRPSCIAGHNARHTCAHVVRVN